MRAIAERGVSGVFALAPPDGFLLGDFEFHRLQAGAFVRAIAERLMRGTTARTPPMRASFDFQSQRLRIANNRFFRHGGSMAAAPVSRRDGNLSHWDFLRCCRNHRLGRLRGECGRRVFLQLRVSLAGHRVEKRNCQPSCKDRCRTTDKMAEFHRIFRKRLLFPLAVSAPHRWKKQPQRSGVSALVQN